MSLFSCSAPYKHLVQQPDDAVSAFVYKPVFNKILYRCIVNGGFLFKKYHLSGLLFFKTLENGTVRAIYQNEMGFTFFDFEWSDDNSFKINSIMPRFDRPALIRTIRKDMELLLMKGLKKETEILFSDGGKTLFRRLNTGNGYAYYIEREGRLERIENAGERAKVMTITIDGKNGTHDMPKHVLFNHHKAKFTIELNKLDSYADE